MAASRRGSGGHSSGARRQRRQVARLKKLDDRCVVAEGDRAAVFLVEGFVALDQIGLGGYFFSEPVAAVPLRSETTGNWTPIRSSARWLFSVSRYSKRPSANCRANHSPPKGWRWVAWPQRACRRLGPRLLRLRRCLPVHALHGFQHGLSRCRRRAVFTQPRRPGVIVQHRRGRGEAVWKVGGPHSRRCGDAFCVRFPRSS
jgi:hypothetical protein